MFDFLKKTISVYNKITTFSNRKPKNKRTMKKITWLIITLFIVCITSCSNEEEIIQPPAKNKILTVSDTATLMFRAMTGSIDGCEEGLEMGKYREKHYDLYGNLIISNIDKFVIEFINNTDSLFMNGHISSAYTYTPYSYKLDITFFKANRVKLQYKFENNALKVLVPTSYTPIWVTVGYGNEEKIEVYLENKKMGAGHKMINHEENPIEDVYYWEIEGSSTFSACLNISQERAEYLLSRQNWQDFFDETHEYWSQLGGADGGAEYYGKYFKGPEDMIRQYQGASWSIFKMTYTLKEE